LKCKEEEERILDHRDVQQTHSGAGRKTRTSVIRVYLVKWHGHPKEDASWEPESSLLNAAEQALATYRKSIGKVLLLFK
jgi:hypothetical protein